MRRRVIVSALLVLFAGMALVGTFQACTLQKEYTQGAEAYVGLEAYAVSAAFETADTAGSGVQWPEVDFSALRAVDPNVVGWLTIEGTGIDYPIAQGTDNVYYLTHLFGGEVNRAGCVFLDCANQADFSDRNSVIYGHHLSDGSMFTPLMGYKDQAFYAEHPTALLMTPGGNYVVRFFAGVISRVSGTAWDMEFETDAAFGVWLADLRANSTFTCDVVPTTSDRILTLSTCSYEFNNARFVLFGVLEPEKAEKSA